MQTLKAWREGWWVDYIENTLDAQTRSVLTTLLQYSETDKNIVDNLVRVKELVAKSETLRPPDSIELEKSLSQKIMTQIMEEPEPRAKGDFSHGLWAEIKELRFRL